MRRFRGISIQLFFILVISVGISACDMVVTDKDGKQSVTNIFATPDFELLDDVKKAIDVANEVPTEEGFNQVSRVFETLEFPAKCDGDEKQEYILAYHAINYMKYRFNGYATPDVTVSQAQRFLILCARDSHKALAGPVFLGIGMHGQHVDADSIYKRALVENDQDILVYAAMGLKYVCDPIADNYLQEIAKLAKIERVKKAIQTNVENRRFIKHRSPDCV